ncbi:hypothetical protein HPB48_009191 [Haemaphysalis longicornis]|uniref:Uncharacterized protein n=1 Tax=Haemaphysalis longicornis TaxID=44386 RepID=A0A9J6FZD6_HAELO|nr:hypothetical protein HPB48_009191 [Haemaphysalis longicornis]
MWVEVFNDVIRPNVAYTPMDTVVLTDAALLQALDNLFSRYTKQDLLRQISLFFLQVFAGLADRDLLLVRFGTEGRAWLYRHIFCATEVEAAFKVVVLSLHVVHGSTPEDRQAVVDQLANVKKAAIQKVHHVSWAESQSKEATIRKLKALRTLLWPPEELLTQDALAKMYANFTKNESSVIGYFLDAHRNSRILRETEEYAEAFALPLNFLLPLANYHYIANSVSIAVAAVSPPLYSPGGTAAMIYGGLGFRYATEMVRALDPAGVRVDADGHVVADGASREPSAWKMAEAAKRSCLAPHYESHFPEIPALEVAYAAFQKAASTQTTAFSFHESGFTEEQVVQTFFSYASNTSNHIRSAERYACARRE